MSLPHGPEGSASPQRWSVTIAGSLLLLPPEEGVADSQGKTLRAWTKGGLRVVFFPSLARNGRGRTRWICGIAGRIEGGKQVMGGEMNLLLVMLLLLLLAVGMLLLEMDRRLTC
jgi:hypothetical protein